MSGTAIMRTTARGVIAAMAMTGLRRVTTTADLVKETPPEAIIGQRAPALLQQVPKERRPVLLELMHWGYGGVGGAMFGMLPESIRRHRWAGPAYGVLLWAGFEAGIAPLLGLEQAKERRPVERAMFLADHVLYGMIVATSPWPHHEPD